MAHGDPYRLHRWIDRFVLVALPCLGLLHADPAAWYTSFLGMFTQIIEAVRAPSHLMWILAFENRIEMFPSAPRSTRGPEARTVMQAVWCVGAQQQ